MIRNSRHDLRSARPMHRSAPALLALLAAAACAFPTSVARKAIELKLPADVQSLSCESHNGTIVVVGDAAVTEIALRAEIEAHAGTQAEADTLLNELSVVHEVSGGKLTIRGKHPERLIGKIASFAFTLRVPPQLALSLGSHNGMVRVDGVSGAVEVSSHNGSILVDTSGNRVDATTHNGEVHVVARGTGELAGAIETHNGETTITIGDGVSTAVDATTENGSIECADGTKMNRPGRAAVRCEFGGGKGQLTMKTHNGNVRIRRNTKN